MRDAESEGCQVRGTQRLLTTCPCTEATDLQVLHRLKNSHPRGDVGSPSPHTPPGTAPAFPAWSSCGSLPARAALGVPVRALLPGANCPAPSSVPGWSQPLHVASQQDNDLVTVLLLRSHRASPALLSLSRDGHTPGWDRHTQHSATCQPPTLLPGPFPLLGQLRPCPEGTDKQTFPPGG